MLAAWRRAMSTWEMMRTQVWSLAKAVPATLEARISNPSHWPMSTSAQLPKIDLGAVGGFALCQVDRGLGGHAELVAQVGFQLGIAEGGNHVFAGGVSGELGDLHLFEEAANRRMEHESQVAPEGVIHAHLIFHVGEGVEIRQPAIIPQDHGIDARGVGDPQGLVFRTGAPQSRQVNGQAQGDGKVLATMASAPGLDMRISSLLSLVRAATFLGIILSSPTERALSVISLFSPTQ